MAVVARLVVVVDMFSASLFRASFFRYGLRIHAHIMRVYFSTAGHKPLCLPNAPPSLHYYSVHISMNVLRGQAHGRCNLCEIEDCAVAIVVSSA